MDACAAEAACDGLGQQRASARARRRRAAHPAACPGRGCQCSPRVERSRGVGRRRSLAGSHPPLAHAALPLPATQVRAYLDPARLQITTQVIPPGVRSVLTEVFASDPDIAA